ncbi:hypothetical protein [Methanobrevibacter sp.]|uniref:hypothetical protein n=1 Tax=Methanobrevibacter sp. TaxID=66852 RepID=UPI0038908090
MDMELIRISQFILEIILFIVLMFVGRFIHDKLKTNDIKILNPQEYFPEEELHSLRQIYFLIMMGLFFIIIIYTLIHRDMVHLALFDIIISLYLAITLDKSSLKNKILLILLVPYGSLTYIVFGDTLSGLIDLIHIPVFMYFMKVYYNKFREYTKSNGLGIAVILLFSIIFISFFITQIVENVNPLDSIVMVSNAFTSNGYAVLGKSVAGKLNSLVLVWGGYLLSGVATATLAAGILIRYFSKRLEEYDKKIDELKELIEKNNKD